MNQQSIPSSPSPASSIATQPESQESTLTPSQLPLTMTQSQLTQQPAPAASALFTQIITEINAPSSQLLATQPNTQIENPLMAVGPIEQSNSNARCGSGRWEEEGGNDEKILQPITQLMAQPCRDAKAMTETVTQLHAGDQCDRFGDTDGGAAIENNGTMKNGASLEESFEIFAGNEENDSDDNSLCVRYDEEHSLVNQKTASSLVALHTSIDASAIEDELTRESSLPNKSLTGTMRAHLFTEIVFNAMEATKATADISQLSNPSRQRAEIASRNDAAGGDATINSDVVHLPIETPHHVKKKVTNPYAKNKKTMSKRTIDQISRSSSPSIVAASDVPNFAKERPINPINPNNATSASAPRKQVYNPYAKPKQTPKQVVRNPYAKIKRITVKNNTTKLHPMKTADTSEKEIDPPAAAARNSPQQSRRAGISISQPMAERLPSRNVSYQPAEILTVGELYRYLYDITDIDQQLSTLNNFAGGENARVAKNADLSAPISNELVSVRITGTLLCVSTSQHCNGDGTKCNNLYSSGTFLLVGDPLENTRFSKKKLWSERGEGNSTDVAATPVVSKVKPKAKLTSILKNKRTLSLQSKVSAVKIPSSNPPSIAATPATKLPDGGCNTVNTSGRSKSMNSGILNTNKKKKLVYNGGGKRLSFGGGGGLGGRGGGLLGRTFLTPKRVNLTGPLSSAKKGLTNRTFSSTLKKGTFSSINPVGAGDGKNKRPENIIQHHHSPIVPIWIGSFYNGDGLDGSVIGDLVMIMGEIVMEHGAPCQKNIADDHFHVDHKGDDENTKAPLAGADETNNISIQEAKHDQLQKPPVTPTRIQGVNDAAISIAAYGAKISSGSSASQSQTPGKVTKSTNFCNQCTRFIRARFVKNVNGTDMSLQREVLRARRKYLAERKQQMECLIPSSLTNSGLYYLGCGPPI